MKKIHLLILPCVAILSACGNGDTLNYERQRVDSLQKQLDSIESVNYSQSQTIINLRDSIQILSYPAIDRLATVKRMIHENNLDGAEIELSNLLKIFPNSQEANQVTALKEQIKQKKDAERREAERIAALGFKALPQNNTVKVDYNTITLSQFSTGKEFIFDSYDDSWFYNTADRGNKYVKMSMSVTSTSHSPELPQFAVYSINGSYMNLVQRFMIRYARWSSYGHYLGNYHDNRNDFSKVSTIPFKLAAEVSDEILSGPYAIVMYNKNVLVEQYDRYQNPPQSWSGSAPFASYLKVDDFKNNYVLIKTFNLK